MNRDELRMHMCRVGMGFAASVLAELDKLEQTEPEPSKPSKAHRTHTVRGKRYAKRERKSR